MDRFLEESWNRTVETEKELTPEEKAFSVILTIEDEISKIKDKEDQEYLWGILNGLRQEIVDYAKTIKVVESPYGKKFETQSSFENKRRPNHNSIISSLLTFYRYLRKDKLNTSWVEDLGYDGDIKNDYEKFDRWEVTDWAINLNGALNLEDMAITVLSEKTIDTEAMKRLVMEIEKKQTKGKIHLLMDNASYNHSYELQDFLKNHKRVHITYLPPYSPNLNIIERLWKFFHTKHRDKYFEKFKEFEKEVLYFFKHIHHYDAELKTLLTDSFQKISV